MAFMIEKTLTSTKMQRLDLFLRECLPNILNQDISNSKIRRVIIAGSVYVNAIQCRIPSFMLKPNSTVKIKIVQEKVFFEKQPNDVDFVLAAKDVLYEDEYLIAINKPAFLPTEQTITGNRKNAHDCVVDYLWKQNPKLRNPPYVGIMHRLDRETSGILLFTKTRSINKDISELFQSHDIKKIYRATCTGILPKTTTWTVENFMGRISSKSSACKMGIVKKENGGLFAKTDFSIAKIDGKFIHIDCLLHTGRTHQIRFHLSNMNLPIVGDKIYGGITSSRMLLHAKHLEFIHPITKQLIIIESCLPKDFVSRPKC